MNKDSAKHLVSGTFQNPFEKERYSLFIRNLLNSFDSSKAFHARGYVPEIFKSYVKTYERIGTYTDPDGKKIDLMIVYLQKETTLERARTSQRNFIARYLKDRDGKDAGLVAFVSPNKEEWRFSFVKMDYKFAETAKGTLVAKEDFTPAKRYSFIVGLNESSHTAKSSLVPIMADDEHNPTLKELEDAFNIEKVSREFFEKYRELFLGLKETLDSLVDTDPVVKNDFSSKGINVVDFSKKLLGQIVFLYFLQKKGWFGVKRGEEWGEGSKRFLKELFEKKHCIYDNFFNDVLEPLFYEALRLERPGDYYSPFKCRIPFLNGGLFDPLKDYDWQDTDIMLPNELFSNQTKTPEGDTGTGILDVFDRYNFTVNEDEPLEKEVAVDPEMLGKVFENLLEVKDRKSKGTYYTPREIVHYMCQESLSNYLTTEFDGKVSKDEIDTLIRYGDTVIEHESRVEQEGKETSTYFKMLPEGIRKNAKAIDDKLSSIKVCDPAVGSGAFPVGMMNEVVRTRTALNPFLKKGDRSTYTFKRDAIQNSLYGVDIDPGAVEIAKLRLWLSLIVDEEDIKKIKPLPNLDYKIVSGNSLLGVEKNLFNSHLFKQLEDLKPLFFNETSAKKKREYKNTIDALIGQITNGHKDFDFEVYFSEVFHSKRGFDVVIGNPPYIEFKKLPASDKSNYANYKAARGKYDIYVLFIELSGRIAAPNGTIAYINPTTFMKKDFGKAIRTFIKDHFRILSIFDFCDFQVFESATNYTGIFLFANQNTAKYDFPYHKYRNTSAIVSSDDFSNSLSSTAQNAFKDLIAINCSKLGADVWNFQSSTLQELFDKLSCNSKPLLHYASEIFQGIASGKDSVFYITENLIEELGLEKEIIFPLLKGKDIKAYAVNWSGYSVIYPYDSNSKVIPESVLSKKFPNVYKYFTTQRESLSGRGYFEKSGKLWYELWNQRKFSNFQKQRIVTPEISDRNNFITTNSFFGNTKTYNIILKNSAPSEYLFFLGLLNSKLLDFTYKIITTPQAGGFYAYKTQFLKKLPIKTFSKEKLSVFIELVGKLLEITNMTKSSADEIKYQQLLKTKRKIDQMVYELYGLNKDEIKLIDESNS